MNTIGAFASIADSLFHQFDHMQEDWQDRLRREWQESIKMPRKKKKLVRKELLLDRRIACWSLF